MNYKVTFPKRAMMLSGPMRSGKTTALVHYIVGVSKHRQHSGRNVLVLVEQGYGNSLLDDLLAHGADMSNIAVVYWGAPLSVMPSPAELHTVVCAVDSVYQEGTTVNTYHTPSSVILDYLRVLDEPTALQPYIMYSAHLPNAIDHPAMG